MSAVQGRFEDQVGSVGFLGGGSIGAFAGAKMGGSLGSVGGVPGAIVGGIIGLLSGVVGGEAVGKAVDGFFEKGKKVDQFMDTTNDAAKEGCKILKHGAESADSIKQFSRKKFSILIPSAFLFMGGITGRYFTSSPDCNLKCDLAKEDYLAFLSEVSAITGLAFMFGVAAKSTVDKVFRK